MRQGARWFAAHRKAARQALQRLFAAPLTMLLSVLGIGIALALPAGGQLLLDRIAALGRGAATTPQLTVFLALDGERTLALAVEKQLGERGDVAQTRLLAREDTLARMKRDAGLADVIGAMPRNPFPDAIVVTPKDESPDAIEKLAAEARQWRGVEHVQIDSDWALRLAAFVRLARTGLLLLAVLLGIGLVAITFSTIRLQVLTRQAEIEVSRLLGATDAFIRRPFLYFGLTQGLLGGIAAWLIVSGSVLLLNHHLGDLASVYASEFSLLSLSVADSATLLGFSAYLGWLGAWFSVSQHLWQIEPR